MKIVVCGSSFFRDRMIENKRKLIEMGHEGIIHPDYEAYARGEKQDVLNQIHVDHAVAKRENGYIKWYYDEIVKSDAILVLNYDKNGVANYIGGNTLMEIAFAHTNGKKVFLMNPVPQEVSYSDEIEAMYDEILNGDLFRIDGSEKGSLDGMKVSVCASVNFSDRVKVVVDDLEHKGCKVDIPFYTRKIIDGEVDLEEYKRIKAEKGDVEFREDAGVDLIKRHFDNIKGTDAILVLNYDKNGLAGYIGGNTFLEMGFAHVLGKKIYVLNELPKMGYSDELLSMGVTVLNGDLSKIVKVKSDVEMSLKIVLATGSPYRQAVFRDAGFEFEARASDIDEKFEGRPTEPSELVRGLARLKAESVAKNFNEGIVIGFDSVGYFDGEILEKPKSREEAFERLRRLSGGAYSFFTGVYMIDVSTGKELTRSIETKAVIRILSDEEINSYLDSDKEQFYKTYAQGFDPMKGLSSTFIKSINGSYLNILQGIPLEVVTEMLEEIR